MQTPEHDKNVFRMFGKSMLREIDLEKMVNELTQIEKDLTTRLHSSEQLLLYAEEEAETTLKKLYETDNKSDILMETSKELMSKIKMLQFNLKRSAQRETELKSNLMKLQEHVMELKLQLVNEKVSSEEIEELENTVKDLRTQMTLEREGLQKQICLLKQENAFDEAVMDPTETVRDIDVRQLKPKDIMKVLLILIVLLFGVLLTS